MIYWRERIIMRTKQPTKCLYHIRYLGRDLDTPQSFITNRSKAVVLMWFFVACFGVRFSLTIIYLMFVFFHTFSSVWVAKWTSFWERNVHSVDRVFLLYFAYTEQKKKLYTYLFSHISANTYPRNIIFTSN